MKKINLDVKTKSKVYPIIIGKNTITQIDSILKLNKIDFEKILIIADSKVPKKYLKILKKKIFSKKKLFTFLQQVKKTKI